jgi:glycosyltransferase involved in cell wall biosynthesis
MDPWDEKASRQVDFKNIRKFMAKTRTGHEVTAETLISVILPVHGKTPWLEEALDSLLSQSHGHLEFVIVLDRPSSSALKVITRFASRESRAVVVNSPRIGLAAALNTGISIAHGDLLARMDADDVMATRRLEIQEKYFQDAPSLQVLGCQADYINEVGSIIGVSALPTRHGHIAFNLLWANPMIHPGLLMRRKLFEDGFYYDENLTTGEDYKLLLQMLKEGVTFGNTRESLLSYRRSGAQMTSNTSAQGAFETEMADDIFRTFVDERKKHFVTARMFLHRFLKSGKLSDFAKFWIHSPASATKLSFLKIAWGFEARHSRRTPN